MALKRKPTWSGHMMMAPQFNTVTPLAGQDYSTCVLRAQQVSTSKQDLQRLCEHVRKEHAPMRACEHCQREGYSSNSPTEPWRLETFLVAEGKLGAAAAFYCTRCGLYANAAYSQT